MTIVLIILLILLTFSSGFFSLSQMSFFSLSTGEVNLLSEDRDARKKLVAKLLKRPLDLLVTLLFCDIGANILIQNTAANLLPNSSLFVKVGVPLVLTLLIGEIIPKTLALPYNMSIAYRVAPIINGLQRLLGPIRSFMTFITRYISRFVFFFLRKEPPISKEELSHVLESSESYGLLTKEEAKLAQGYLSLTDYTVRERMNPRDEIIYYNLDEPISKLIYLFVEKECSRVPICKGDLQNMQGILSAKRFFLHKNKIISGSDTLPYLKKPYYVPETILAKTLLRHFLRRRESMGIVVDEYGSISGLITLEDLFEVVVGDIVDQRDEKSRYTTAGEDVIITSGKFELAEFEELFNIALPTDNNVVTLGGWLTEQLGDLPKSGTKYVWGKFHFHVLAADPNRIRRIYIRKAP